MDDTCFRCPDGETCYSIEKGTSLFTKLTDKTLTGGTSDISSHSGQNEHSCVNKCVVKSTCASVEFVYAGTLKGTCKLKKNI